MKILKKKASDYNKVNDLSIIAYCQDYLSDIDEILKSLANGEKVANRTALKQTAAELETIKKRLCYYVLGEY